MEMLEQLKIRAESSIPGLHLEIIPNGSAAGQPSLLVDHGYAVAFAKFLREDAQLRMDYASNVTGVDWPDTVIIKKKKKDN